MGDGGDSDADPPAHATQLCAARRWVRTARGARPRRMRRPDRTSAVSRGPCPSLRVLSPPQLATRFARRHKARRRLPDASSAEQTTPSIEGATTTRRTCPTGGLRPSKNWQRSDSPRKAQGKTGGHAWTGLRAFPTRFPPPSAQRTSQDLDTSAQLFVGRENCPFRLASGHRGHFSIRAGRSVRSSGQKNPLFSLECPFPACASISRPPCAPRRHPLPARSMAPPRWVFQQKSPAVSQFRPPALCFAVAPRRAALIEAYRAAERVDGTGTRIARGAKRVFVGIFHRPAALTRARPFVTLGAIWPPGVGRI